MSDILPLSLEFSSIQEKIYKILFNDINNKCAFIVTVVVA